MATEKWVNLGLGNGFIWSNAGMLLIGALGTNSKWNFNRNSYILIKENAFEKVILENGGHLVLASMC